MKCTFHANAEHTRNLKRIFFGAVCSDINKTNSKDKREKSQSFGTSQSIATRTCAASREEHNVVEDKQKRDIVMIEGSVSKRYISKERNIKDHC